MSGGVEDGAVVVELSWRGNGCWSESPDTGEILISIDAAEVLDPTVINMYWKSDDADQPEFEGNTVFLGEG